MISYQMDYVVDEVLKNLPTEEQVFLKKYLNKDFPRKEAIYLWEKIVEHKWYVGERLKRDIGFRAAAVDYFENFYEPTGNGRQTPNRAPQNVLSPITFAA